MSSYTMKLHDVGEGVAEAEIVEWRVQVGDAVTSDDVVAEMMSDKATVELYSPVDGVVTWLAGDVGDIVAVGAELLRFDVDGDVHGDRPPAEPAEVAEALDSDPVEPDTGPPEPAQVAPEQGTPALPNGRRRTLAAPAVRARASTLGIDLATIDGTGPDGRVVHADLDAVLTRSSNRTPSAPAPAEPVRAEPRPAVAVSPPGPAEPDEIESIKVTGLRRNIAERMQAAKRRIPHFTYVEEVDVTELERLRRELNATATDQRPKLTLLPFVMRAVVHAVRDHPEMNARYDDEAGVVDRHRAVHLGIAVQTERGLMVTVVRSAGALDLWQSAEAVTRLSESARNGKIKLDELTGSTITITSLGALGGVVSTPVINAPEVAIVGINKIATRPVYVEGAVVPRQIMNLSSSFDHRIIDGVNAAEFVLDIKRLLETPALLFTG